MSDHAEINCQCDICIGSRTITRLSDELQRLRLENERLTEQRQAETLAFTDIINKANVVASETEKRIGRLVGLLREIANGYVDHDLDLFQHRPDTCRGCALHRRIDAELANETEVKL